MKINFDTKLKYNIDFTSNFKKQFKKVIKQGKDINKFKIVLNKLGNLEPLEKKYKDHYLYNDKNYNNCRECHIEPDWLLIYQYQDDKVVLMLVATGSHPETLNK